MNRRQALSTIGASTAALAAFRSLAARPAPEDAHGAHAAGRSGSIEECARACADCLLECSRAFKHCLDQVAGGRKEHSKCLEHCADSIELCSSCAALCGRASPSLHHACEACARCCEDCARECELLGDPALKACIEACRRCAKACRAVHAS